MILHTGTEETVVLGAGQIARILNVVFEGMNRERIQSYREDVVFEETKAL